MINQLEYGLQLFYSVLFAAAAVYVGVFYFILYPVILLREGVRGLRTRSCLNLLLLLSRRRYRHHVVFSPFFGVGLFMGKRDPYLEKESKKGFMAVVYSIIYITLSLLFFCTYALVIGHCIWVYGR